MQRSMEMIICGCLCHSEPNIEEGDVDAEYTYGKDGESICLSLHWNCFCFAESVPTKFLNLMCLQSWKPDTQLTAAARLQHKQRRKRKVLEPTPLPLTRVGWQAGQQGAALLRVESWFFRNPWGNIACQGATSHLEIYAESQYQQKHTCSITTN